MRVVGYWIELATDENTVLALDPINRTVPTTMTRITASITAYSAISCPLSPLHRLRTSSIKSPSGCDFFEVGRSVLHKLGYQTGTPDRDRTPSATQAAIAYSVKHFPTVCPLDRVIIPCNISERS